MISPFYATLLLLLQLLLLSHIALFSNICWNTTMLVITTCFLRKRCVLLKFVDEKWSFAFQRRPWQTNNLQVVVGILCLPWIYILVCYSRDWSSFVLAAHWEIAGKWSILNKKDLGFLVICDVNWWEKCWNWVKFFNCKQKLKMKVRELIIKVKQKKTPPRFYYNNRHKNRSIKCVNNT